MLRNSSCAKWSTVFVTGLALGLSLVSTSPALAGTIVQFDPNGALAGGPGTVGAVTFDEAPGNALVVGALVPGTGIPVLGTPLDVYYQATIDSLKDASSTNVVNYGAAGNTPGQLTITAHFRELITSVTPVGATGATITLSGVGVAQPANEVNIYYNAVPVFNNLLGTGFTTGTLVYTGTANMDANGTFTRPDNGTQVLDQFVDNNYVGLLSTPGPGTTGGQQSSGGTTVSVTTTFFNTDFFKTNLTGANLGFFFNTSNILPFHDVDPAAQTYNGIGAAGTPTTGGVVAANTIGTINGFSGPNILLQSDANSSFEQAVPEPSTFFAALTGIGLASLAGLRAKWNRNTSAA